MRIKENSCKNEKYWENSLMRFNIPNIQGVETCPDFVKKYGTFKQKIFKNIWNIYYYLQRKFRWARNLRLQVLIFKCLSKHGLYFLTNGYANLPINRSDNKFVSGTYEDYRWFDGYREQLLVELTPKENIKFSNRELYNSICNNNSVCVSLRRWEIDVHNESDLQNRILCNEDYYKKAINIIIEKVEKPLFVVFSDDVEWAKNIIRLCAGGEIDVISESGQDDVAEKLRLMYSCKHFIIANSTFSWWAQYLSRNTQKIVVSPSRWFVDGLERNNLIMENFITICAFVLY